MDPPVDAIETSTATIWVEGGIVVDRTSGTPSSAETLEENFAVFRDLTRDSHRPFLLDARRWWGGGAGALAKAVESMEATFTAVAMLVEPETAEKMGPFPAIVNRLLIPFQVFTDEAAALAFLQDYLPREQSILEPSDNAIETTTATVWFDGGILFERSNGLSTTSETVSELFVAFRDLTDGVPAPLLFDARRWPGGNVGAWTTFVSEQASTLTAIAMLFEVGSSPGTGPFFLDRLEIPTRAFTDAASALAFLRGFLASD